MLQTKFLDAFVMLVANCLEFGRVAVYAVLEIFLCQRVGLGNRLIQNPKKFLLKLLFTHFYSLVWQKLPAQSLSFILADRVWHAIFGASFM